MEISLYTLLLLPIGLGLLGFIEPCTIGAHLIFLNTQDSKSAADKRRAVLVFIIVRSLMTGLFGALIAFAGQLLVDIQTNLWLIFGSVYLLMGLLFLLGRSSLIKKRIQLAPETWKRASSPITLGLAFGLNIPACAAPIIFGLLGLAATTGSVFSGFAMMFMFGFALSAPLVFLIISPGLSERFSRLAHILKKKTWVLGVIFIALGIWSIWFGLNVNPAEWA